MNRKIQMKFPPGGRSNGYAGAKNLVRNYRLGIKGYETLPLVVIGERSYSKDSFVEPSERWDSAARIHTGFNGINGNRKVVALGVSRTPNKSGQYELDFVQIGEYDDWLEFKRTHKVFLLGVYHKLGR